MEAEVVEQVGNNEGAGGSFGYNQDLQTLSQQEWGAYIGAELTFMDELPPIEEADEEEDEDTVT